ncbi:MAG: hypothetical protein ACRDY6_16870 [Acidimicrobiia bacterium]
MARRVRRIALVVVVLVVIAGAALVVTSRGRLTDDRDQADELWLPLRAPLAERYASLDAVLTQLRDAGAGDRDVTRDLARGLDRWNRLQRTSSDDVDTEAEVHAANDLEGLFGRASQTVASSPRLSGVEPLTAVVDAVRVTAPPAAAVSAYNDAAQAYQDTREEARYSLTARLFGYEPRPTLLIGG